MSQEKEIAWDKGETDRPLMAVRPCSCGCDRRYGDYGVGYLTGSDKDGYGFTIWIESEIVFQRLRDALDREILGRNR